MTISSTVSAEDRLLESCTRFMYLEAECLDRRQFDDWLNLLHPSIDYRVPVRTTRLKKDVDGFSTSSFFLKETFGTLSLRVERLRSEYAWSENPATRTRRMIANIRAVQTEIDRECDVISNLAIFCYRGDNPAPVILTGERQDRLVAGDTGWRLKKRTVLLDMTVLEIESLSFFL